MQTEYIIVGQGLCGTWLSWYLQKEKKSFLVIDNDQPNTASRIAAGIINPVTGRRIVKTWMIDELLPFIETAYTEFGKKLGIKAISPKTIIDFFPTPQMREAFLKRKEEETVYLHEADNLDELHHFFNYEFGYGIINPAFIVHMETLLPAWRKTLQQNNQLLQEEFDHSRLTISPDKIAYKGIIAEKIIFCDGINSFNNPLFQHLPFAFNKGEALIIEANDLSQATIYKKGILLAPLQEAGTYWVGTNYIWEFKDNLPAKEFRNQTEKHLKDWLKVPFKTLDHVAAVRPATIERRPFVGMHPVYGNVGLLNGMGSKGCSLVPYFAKQLTDHLIYKKEILPEADIKRFSKILAR
ncbi:MAG: NAD(P)/FAD-dependent oxidoreductase [Chitinophagales bacterium]